MLCLNFQLSISSFIKQYVVTVWSLINMVNIKPVIGRLFLNNLIE